MYPIAWYGYVIVLMCPPNNKDKGKQSMNRPNILICIDTVHSVNADAKQSAFI